MSGFYLSVYPDIPPLEYRQNRSFLLTYCCSFLIKQPVLSAINRLVFIIPGLKSDIKVFGVFLPFKWLFVPLDLNSSVLCVESLLKKAPANHDQPETMNELNNKITDNANKADGFTEASGQLHAALHPDRPKLRQLKKHKTLATICLVCMALLYLCMVYLLKHRPGAWMGYVKAFAEAGVVGALADWFAVTALFHHPMGLKIPHTNLIERKKATIGNNLGGFVVDNFLTPMALRPYFEKLDVATMAGNYLAIENNRVQLIAEALKMAAELLEKTDDQAAARFLKNKGRDLLETVKLGPTLGGGLDLLLDQGQDQRLLNYLLDNLKHYIAENEDLVKDRVKKESGFLVPGFVDNMLANRITVGLANYIHEIHQTANHPLRQELRSRLRTLSADLKTGEKFEADLQQLKAGLLSETQLEGYAMMAWQYLKDMLLQEMNYDAALEGSTKLSRYLDRQLVSLADHLKNDPKMAGKVNHWIRLNAYRLTLRNRARVGELISRTVGNWQGKDLSEKLELEVGKDLQFIRINGTIVGGLVGLLIYTITQFL